MKSKGDDGTRHICPQCKEEFYISPLIQRWGWVIGTEANPIPVCSYKCQRASERKAKGKPKQQRNRVPVRIRETGEVFRSISECAAYLNTSNNSIYRCIDRGIPFYDLHIERVVG